ncbi:MAG: cold shock domain-containing protein [Tissierellia bacterium]|nr:cold shock domain-containing protein [Tissierellia bacterium]
MARGIVKNFDEKRGFGFITSEGGLDAFVHYSDIKSDDKYKTLTSGEEVKFELIDSERGLKAINVEKIKK